GGRPRRPAPHPRHGDDDPEVAAGDRLVPREEERVEVTSTDDEAFLRAILAAPGDAAPRLVYADWLDEPGGPRGAYLRAEAERPGSETLWRRGEELDPVWVARVSRPPIGVCCDHVRFHDGGPTLSASDLHVVEVVLDVCLPAAYRAFLLNWNG